MRNRLTALILALGLTASGARAAELTVLSGGSMYEPLKAAGEAFTKATGTKLNLIFGTTNGIVQKVRGGEAADVIVIAAPALKPLQADGLVGPETPLATAVIGGAVKAGARRPDISTPDKFKAALLGARSIAYPNPDPKVGATAGIYLGGLFERMGVADAVRAKSVLEPNGVATASAVAAGQAELGLTFVSELQSNPALTVIGALPPSIQSPTPYAAVVASRSADPAAARGFIAFVTSPGQRATLKAAGVEPATP